MDDDDPEVQRQRDEIHLARERPEMVQLREQLLVVFGGIVEKCGSDAGINVVRFPNPIENALFTVLIRR